MNRREILGAMGAGSLAVVAGCTNEPSDDSDEPRSTESENESDTGSDEQQSTDSESYTNPEQREDFSFNNKTPSLRQLTMTVTNDSDTIVFQESYQLDPRGEERKTISELRAESYGYKFEASSSSAMKESFSPQRTTQLRVKIHSTEINLFEVA